MNLEFILDENYLALYILCEKMHNESKEIQDIKNNLKLDNNIGYKKILEEIPLQSSIYLSNENINQLISEFISTNKFGEIYKLYNDESREDIAIKILKGYIKINDDELEQTKDFLWKRYKDGYQKLLNMNFYNTSIFLLDDDVIQVIDNFKKTKEFKRIYKETSMYLKEVQNYWKLNKDNIDKYLKKILKIDLNIDLMVYICHPDTCQGYQFDNNKIAWGHYKGIDDLNYNIVYLVHEGLHALLPFNNDESDINCYIKHSIIELISDYELYSLLNGESTLKEGHPFLEDYRKFIYPYWLKYIGLNDSEINKRLKRDFVDLNNDFDIEDNDLSKMDIYNFIDYCNLKYEQINYNKINTR